MSVATVAPRSVILFVVWLLLYLGSRCVHMASLSPLDHVRAIERYIQSEVAMGLSTVDVACASSLPLLVSRIRATPNISMMDVTATNEYLMIDNGMWNREQRRELATVVKAAMKSEIVGTGKLTIQGQANLYLYNYLPAKLWAVLFSTDDIKNKFRTVAAFLVKNLGMRHITEKTKRLAVVIVHIASGVTPEPDESYEHMREFARAMEQKRSSVSGGTATMVNFPEDHQAFITVYPDAFGPDDQPVPCRIDIPTIIERCRSDVTPSRGTNAQLAGKKMSKRRPDIVDHRRQSDPQGLQSFAMHALMSQYMRGNAPLPDDFGITYGQRRPRVEPLALEDGPLALEYGGSIIAGGIAPGCLQPPPANATATSATEKLAALQAEIATSTHTKASKARSSSSEFSGSSSTVDASKCAVAVGKRKLKAKAQRGKGATKANTVKNEKKVKNEKEVKKEKKVKKEKVDKTSKKYAKAKSGQPSASGPSAKIGKPSQKEAKLALHKQLLKRPAAANRPKFSLTPIKHGGGRIYFSQKKHAFRVYKRGGDKVESHVNTDGTLADERVEFQIACAMIEADPRPQ